jgi:hypothetical protein
MQHHSSGSTDSMVDPKMIPTKSPLSAYMVEGFFFVVFAAFAAASIITPAAQVLGVSFQLYALFSSFSVFLVCILSTWYYYSKTESTIFVDKYVFIIVSLSGLAGATLALLCLRPDADDYWYLPNVVFALENVSSPMSFEIHCLAPVGKKLFVSYGFGSALAFEYFQGVIAYVVGADLLSVYYILAPAITGLMIPLALYYAISRFTEDPIHAAFGMVITVLLILLIGEQHVSYGNFSFNRIFQGKAVFLSVCIPVFAGASFEYFRKPSTKHWLMLFAVATAATGLTVTSLVLVPFLAVPLAVSGVMTFDERKPSVGLKYLISLSFVILAALITRLLSPPLSNAENPINTSHPLTFFGQFIRLFYHGDLFPTGFTALAVSVIAGFFLINQKQRKFLLIWAVASSVLYLNPVSAYLLIRHITGANVYWRLFYVFPFPLLAGICVAAGFSRMKPFPTSVRAVTAIVICVALMVAHFPLSSTSIFRTGTQISSPGLKLHKKILADARDIVEAACPGPMLAPKQIAGVIPLLNSSLPQLVPRDSGLLNLIFATNDLIPLGQTRVRACYYVSAKNEDLDSLREVIQQEDLSSIVLQMNVHRKEDALELLLSADFSLKNINNRYIIACRNGKDNSLERGNSVSSFRKLPYRKLLTRQPVLDCLKTISWRDRSQSYTIYAAAEGRKSGLR